MEISGVVRRSVSGSIQDPGSTRMPLQVRDLEGRYRQSFEPAVR
jgi:hypothetical protein